MLGSDWHTSKQKAYNWPRVTCNRPMTDLRARDPRTPFVSRSTYTRLTESKPRPDRLDTHATDLWLTCDALWPISDRPTTWVRPPRVTCLTWQKFAWDKNFKSDSRPIYHRIGWFTTCEDLQTVATWVTRKWNWQDPWLFLTVKSGHRACRFRWRVSPSYCEYLGAAYDLLVSKIGGTCNLADQLPSNYKFGHFLVISRSQVPQDFGINLALDAMIKMQRYLCSVRLADLIRTTNAMVVLFSLAEFSLTRVVNRGNFWNRWRFVDQAMLIADLSTLSVMTWHQGKSYNSWEV